MNNKKPIRILQVLGGLDIGGAETMVMNYYRNIDKSMIQFDFVVHGNNHGFYEEEIKKMGGKIYRVPKYRLYNHFNYIKAWRTLFKNHLEYRIIHSHVRSTASIILKVAKENGLITICHSHSTSNGTGLSAFVKKKLQKKIPYVADYLFSCSKESAIWLYGKKNANSERCYIINNAIDVSKYSFNMSKRKQVRSSLKIDNKIVIGMIGRLAEVKNHSFAINLLKELVKYNKKYHLLIIGSGPLKNNLVSQVKDYNLVENVTFLENRSDVNELLQAIDIFIMPSLWEGLPLALVEAQAASLPCVVSNNVTDGIIIEELVKKIEIDDVKKWIEYIKDDVNIAKVRLDRSKMIKDNGFDIKDNASKLSSFYLNLK